MKDFTPMNANERLLYAMVKRQDAIIEQLNSIVEYISKKDEVATISVVVDEKQTAKAESKSETKEEAKEEVKEEPKTETKPKARRTRTKKEE